MKRFWINLLLLLPVPLLVIGFNWFVDPVHLRNPDAYEHGIAHLVLAGKRVTNISNPNEAAFLEFVIAGLPARKEVLVFGSSRSKLIRSDSFPGHSLFNNSISGGGLVDYLAIYQMYRRKGLVPSLAVVELSPWILMRDYSSVWKAFNAQKQSLEQQALAPSDGGNGPVKPHTLTHADLTEFLSPGYFQTSFYTWLNHRTHPSRQNTAYCEWREGALPLGETMLADGSAIYPEHVQHPPDRERVTALAIQYAEKPAGIPTAIDPGRERVLEAFLDELARDGVRVVLYLPPYHPRSYSLMANSPQNRIIVDEQRVYETLARRKNLTLVGSYNPSDLGLDERAFFDGSHPTEETVRQIFAAALPGAGVQTAADALVTSRIEFTGIDNPNGLETVNHKPFFWIGDGDTCLSVRSSRAGLAVLAFQAEPGPSLPATPVRHLALKASDGGAQSISLNEYPEVEMTVPVKQGANEICLTALDKSTVPQQPNGDRRPLLVGVSDLRIRLLPLGADQPAGQPCPFALRTGWHQVEHNGPDWLCWNDGRGLISIVVSTNTTATLSGQILAAERPNDVDVLVNGSNVATLEIAWTNWAFREFDPVTLPLKSGSNVVEFISHRAAIRLPSDNRLLAVAVKNLAVTVTSNQPLVVPRTTSGD